MRKAGNYLILAAMSLVVFIAGCYEPTAPEPELDGNQGDYGKPYPIYIHPLPPSQTEVAFGLIGDTQLLAQLSSWQRELDNIEDISFELRAESVRVRRAMERHGGPFARWRRKANDPGVFQWADGETMANLRRDAELMGAAMSHQYALNAYIRQLSKLAENIDSIVTLLDQRAAGR